MAATDARPVPRKNTAFRYYFPIRKNDGTLITSWASADSEVSIDGGSFADCTNEATEIGTTGVGYIDLTAGELNGDAVVYKLTVTNTGALPVVVTFFPEESGDYRADVTHFGGTAGTFSSGRPEVNTTHWGGTAVATATILAAANIASDAFTAAKFAANAITSAKIATDAIGAAQLAADAVAEIQSGLSTLNAAGVRSAVGLAAANLDIQLGNLDEILNRLPDCMIEGTVSGTPTTTSIVGASGGSLSSTNDLYNQSFLAFTSGTLKGLAREITDYVGSSRTFSVDAFPAAAANADTFIIVGNKDT